MNSLRQLWDQTKLHADSESQRTNEPTATSFYPCIADMDSLEYDDEHEVASMISSLLCLLLEPALEESCSSKRHQKALRVEHGQDTSSSSHSSLPARANALLDATEPDSFREFAKANLLAGLPVFKPEVPKQKNLVDCALFTITYAEEMIRYFPDVTYSDFKRGVIPGFSSELFSGEDMSV